MAIEIVDFPMKNGGSFHLAMLVIYQRVSSFGLNDSRGFKLLRPLKCLVQHGFCRSVYQLRAICSSGINSPEQRAKLGVMLRSVFPRFNLIGGLGHDLYFSTQLGSTTSQ